MTRERIKPRPSRSKTRRIVNREREERRQRFEDVKRRKLAETDERRR